MKRNSILLGIILMVLFMMPLSIIAQPPAAETSVNQDVSLKLEGKALLAVTGSGTHASPKVDISLSGATEAGAEVMTSASNSDTRLRLSSLVEASTYRTISASISKSLASSGTTLSIELAPQDNFQPALVNAGTSSGPMDVTEAIAGAEAILVTGIGTCWSGTADGDGYIITYTYAKKDGATALVSNDIVVTFTISVAI